MLLLQRVMPMIRGVAGPCVLFAKDDGIRVYEPEE